MDIVGDVMRTEQPQSLLLSCSQWLICMYGICLFDFTTRRRAATLSLEPMQERIASSLCGISYCYPAN